MNRLPFAQKLAVLALAPAVGVVFLMAVAFVVADRAIARRHALAEAERLVEMLAPLAAQSIGAGTDPAAFVRAAGRSPVVRFIALDGADGVRLAAFGTEATDRDAGDEVRVVRELEAAGRPTRLTLSIDTSSLARTAEERLLYVAGAVSIAILLLFGIYKSAESFVLRPLKHLVFTARMISEARNFAVRARPLDDREIASVGDALNVLLERVRERDESIAGLEEELRQAKSTLRPLATEPVPVTAAAPPPSRAETPPIPRALPAGLRVLLAEDNEVNATLALRLLEKQGCVVTLVVNGKLAVEAWKRGEFDVILMDVIMPEMDGLEATGMIRTLETTLGTRTPILALTGNTTESDKAVFQAAGMDGCVGKPLNVPALVEAVLAALSGTVHTVGSASTLIDRSMLSEDAAESRVIDRKNLLLRLDGDIELLQEMVRMFDARRSTLAGDVAKALEARDQEAFVRAVHTLKGTVATLGSLAAFELAKELEVLGRKNDLDAAVPRLAELDAELEVFREALGLLVRSEAA